MNNLFKYQRAINSILYSLQKLGGKTDMHKICKILYFADQKHLAQYGRSITGDTYIAMRYGPVPSYIDDLLKAIRGDSFFSSSSEIEPLKDLFVFENRFIIRGLKAPDLNELSRTDTECLDYAVNLCRDKSFDELTKMSHGIAWNNTMTDRAMSIKDILREIGEDESYADYIADSLRTQKAFM